MDKFNFQELDLYYSVNNEKTRFRRLIVERLKEYLKQDTLLSVEESVDIIQKNKEGEIFSPHKVVGTLIRGMKYLRILPCFNVTTKKFPGLHLQVFLVPDLENWEPRTPGEQKLHDRLEKRIKAVISINQRALFAFLLNLMQDHLFFTTRLFLNTAIYLPEYLAGGYTYHDLLHDLNVTELGEVDSFLEMNLKDIRSIPSYHLTLSVKKESILLSREGNLLGLIPLQKTLNAPAVIWTFPETGKQIQIKGFPYIKSQTIPLTRIENYLSGENLNWYMENIYSRYDDPRKEYDQVYCLNLFSGYQGADWIIQNIQQRFYHLLGTPGSPVEGDTLLRSLPMKGTKEEAHLISHFKGRNLFTLDDYTKLGKLIKLLGSGKVSRGGRIYFSGLINFLTLNGVYETNQFISGDIKEKILGELKRYISQRLYIHFYRDLVNDLICQTDEDQGNVQFICDNSYLVKYKSFKKYLLRPELLEYKNFRNLAHNADIQTMKISRQGEIRKDMILIPYENIRKIFIFLLKGKYTNESRLLGKIFYALEEDMNKTSFTLSLEGHKILIRRNKDGQLDFTIDGHNHNIQDLDQSRKFLPRDFSHFQVIKIVDHFFDKKAFGFSGEKEFKLIKNLVELRLSLEEKLRQLFLAEKNAQNPFTRGLLRLRNLPVRGRLNLSLKKLEKETGPLTFTSKEDVEEISAPGKRKKKSPFSEEETRLLLFLYKWLIEKRDKNCTARLYLKKNSEGPLRVDIEKGDRLMESYEEKSNNSLNGLLDKGMITYDKKRKITIINKNRAAKVWKKNINRPVVKD